MFASTSLRVVLLLIAMLAVTVGGTGCASIVHGGDRKVEILTTPSGANFTVSNFDTKEVVATGTTPATVKLDPHLGYFKGQRYVVNITPPAGVTTAPAAMTTPATTATTSPVTTSGGGMYQAARVEIHPKLTGWYFGNILFGGVIGMVIVDPLTGAMWDLGPSTINHSFITGETLYEKPKEAKKDKKASKSDEKKADKAEPAQSRY